jgi:ABC-type oligopeptide transport system ATPase subunit
LLKNSITFRGTSWAVKEGENWTILGENGSKSSLAKSICGNAPVTDGKIEYPSLTGTGFAATFNRPPRDHMEYVFFQAFSKMLVKQGSFYQIRWNSFMTDDTLSVERSLSSKKGGH